MYISLVEEREKGGWVEQCRLFHDALCHIFLHSPKMRLHCIPLTPDTFKFRFVPNLPRYLGTPKHSYLDMFVILKLLYFQLCNER